MLVGATVPYPLQSSLPLAPAKKEQAGFRYPAWAVIVVGHVRLIGGRIHILGHWALSLLERQSFFLITVRN
jgi:hypothetical protein